jgi:hypothetical protein
MYAHCGFLHALYSTVHVLCFHMDSVLQDMYPILHVLYFYMCCTSHFLYSPENADRIDMNAPARRRGMPGGPGEPAAAETREQRLGRMVQWVLDNMVRNYSVI